MYKVALLGPRQPLFARFPPLCVCKGGSRRHPPFPKEPLEGKGGRPHWCSTPFSPPPPVAIFQVSPHCQPGQGRGVHSHSPLPALPHLPGVGRWGASLPHDGVRRLHHPVTPPNIPSYFLCVLGVGKGDRRGPRLEGGS